MAYKSKAQADWAHSKEGMEALGGPAKVQEWDKASAGLNLPDRIGPKKEKKESKQRRSSGVRWTQPKWQNWG